MFSLRTFAPSLPWEDRFVNLCGIANVNNYYTELHEVAQSDTKVIKEGVVNLYHYYVLSY